MRTKRGLAVLLAIAGVVAAFHLAPTAAGANVVGDDGADAPSDDTFEPGHL